MHVFGFKQNNYQLPRKVYSHRSTNQCGAIKHPKNHEEFIDFETQLIHDLHNNIAERAQPHCGKNAPTDDQHTNFCKKM
jgi:hypothetical protein